jgi:hypothetical protein
MLRRTLLALAGAAALAAPAAHGAPLDKKAARAFNYGYAPVLHRLSQATFPVNTMIGLATLATPEDRLVVRPNVDTAYSVARLDLRGGPQIVHVPALGDRYYSLQLMDAYTNVFAYIGSRTTGTGAGDYALVAPGYSGPLPDGVRRIDSPTADVLLLGRTLVRDEQDLPAVKRILGQYTLAAPGEAPRSTLVLDDNPSRTPPALPSGLDFFDTLAQVLADDPPPAADARTLENLKALGVVPGEKPAPPSDAARAALERAVEQGPDALVRRAEKRAARVSTQHAGWFALDPRTGDYGTAFGWRAIVARIGLWANTPAESVYPIAPYDGKLQPLRGSRRYVLHFDRDELPPVHAFWSLTMYDAQQFLYANPLKRYAVGDRTRGLKYDKRGGLTLRIQHARPKRGAANWLPAPKSAFTVMLRLYWPRPSALQGRWAPPGLRRLR